MIALKGEIKDNVIVAENDISAYDGDSVIITILDRPISSRKSINLAKYGRRTERGQHVEAYMREMRDNDRI